MLHFWAHGKDVYSTLNKTEVYFKMKHHLKLLRKHPSKKHLHFFQNPFPIFLLPFFFFFLSIETSLFDQHEFTKHSSQPTCIISVGKNSYLHQAFCPVRPLLRRQRENRPWERWVDFPETKTAAGWWHTHQHTGIHQPKQREEGSGCLLSLLEQDEHSVESVVVPLLLARKITSESLWWKRNTIDCIQCSTYQASSFWHLM